jgi:uncharacterized protein YutE (UPF0331/DUF86 family)
MDGRHIQVARRKLSALRDYLDKLEQLLEIPQSAFDGDPRNRLAAERLIQVIVECAIDCNGLLILDRGQKPPPDHRGTFHLLADLQIIPQEMVAGLIRHLRTRNRIVHEYDRPTAEEIYSSAAAVAGDFEEYVQSVARALDTESESR